MILNALSALYLDSVSIHLHDCAVAFLGSETIQRSQQVLIDTYLDKYLLIIILCHFFLLFFLSFFFLHNLWIWLAFFMTGLNRWLLHSKNNHYLWLNTSHKHATKSCLQNKEGLIEYHHFKQLYCNTTIMLLSCLCCLVVFLAHMFTKVSHTIWFLRS